MKVIIAGLVLVVVVALVSCGSDSASSSIERHMWGQANCTKTGDQDACCGKDAYISSKQYCCNRKISDKKSPGMDACCGWKLPYDSTQSKCCKINSASSEWSKYRVTNGTCPS